MTLAQWQRLATVIQAAALSAPNPFIGLPDEDDEFTLEASSLTSPDLADAGWTVQLAGSPHTPFQRAGDVVLYGLHTTPNTYRSTLVGDKLLLQTPNSDAMQLLKAVQPDEQFTLQVYAFPFQLAGSAAMAMVSSHEDLDDPSAVRYFAGYRLGNYGEASITGTTQTPYTNVAYTSVQPLDTFLNYDNLAGSWTCRIAQPEVFRTFYDPATIRDINLQPVLAGALLQFPVAGFLQCIRRLPLYTYAGVSP